MDLFKPIVFIITLVFIQEITNNEILLPHYVVKRSHESDLATIKCQPTKAIDHHKVNEDNDVNKKHTARHVDTPHSNDVKASAKSKVIKEKIEEKLPATGKNIIRPKQSNHLITERTKPSYKKKNYKIVLIDSDNDNIDQQANITGIEDISDFISHLDEQNKANSVKLNDKQGQNDKDAEKTLIKPKKEPIVDTIKTVVPDHAKKVEKIIDKKSVGGVKIEKSDEKMYDHKDSSKEEVNTAKPKDNPDKDVKPNKVERKDIKGKESIKSEEKIYEETYKKSLATPSPWTNVYCFNNSFYLGKSTSTEDSPPKTQPEKEQNIIQYEPQNTPNDYTVTYEPYDNKADVIQESPASEEPILENYWNSYTPILSPKKYYDQSRYYNKDALNINQYNNKINNQKASLLSNKGSVPNSNPGKTKAVSNPQVYLNSYNTNGTNYARSGMPPNYYNLMKRAWINRKTQFDI